MSWNVTLEPEGDNPGIGSKIKDAVGAGPDEPGVNASGMVIYLTDGRTKKETSRVAYVRRNSKNPKVTFEKQLKAEVEKAKSAAKMLNELASEGLQ